MSKQARSIIVFDRKTLADRDYWTEALDFARAPEPPLCELFGAPREAAEATESADAGGARRFRIDGALYASLDKMTRGGPFLIYTTVMAALKVVLYRYQGRHRVVVGSPLRRGEDEAARVDGSLAIVDTVHDRMGFHEVLMSVRQSLLAAYEHQRYPLARLLGDLRLDRPPFDIVLGSRALHHDIELPDSGVAIMLEPGDGHLDVSVRHTADYPAAAVDTLGARLRQVLARGTAEPKVLLADLDVASAEERRVIADSNATAAPVDRTHGDGLVPEWVAAMAARSPDAPAVGHGDELLSYAELDRQANRLSAWLRTKGVKRERVVALLLAPGVDFPLAALAVLKAGGAYLPLNPRLPQSRLEYIVQDAGARVVITRGADAAWLAQAGLHVVDLDADAADIARMEAGPAHAPLTPDSLAYVIYTSGSTGQPKGVAVQHGNLRNLVSWHQRYHEIGPDDRATQIASLDFDAAVWELWPYLTLGASVHVVPAERRGSSAELLAWLAENRITRCFLSTPLAELVVAEPWPQDMALRTLLTGGDRLHRAPAQALPCAFVNHYGPTEVTVVTTCDRVRDDDHEPVPPIGRPIANLQVHLLDQNLAPVPIGIPGEIYIAGASLARGYLGRPGLTAERFVPCPFSADPGARMYRTGDRARYLPDGRLEFLGRIDHQLKVRGYRIEAGEVEHSLAQHPAVSQAVVLAHGESSSDSRLVAYVKTRDSGDAATHQALDHWRMLFDEHIYRDPSEHQDDPTFNITGWSSSFTKAAMSVDEMREWVDDTVDRILSLQPRRVLEIGCGTGLLLLKIAPRCEHYLGTDFSAVSMSYLREQMARLPEPLSQVELRQRNADDFEGIEPKSCDVVVFNSVVQYFPDPEYWARVFDGVMRSVAPGGSIFIGDIRSLPLLRAFRVAVEMFQADDALDTDELRRRVDSEIALDNELIFDPAHFYALQQRYPSIEAVEIWPKRGRHANELTGFRYQVVLRIAGRRPGAVHPRRAPADSVIWHDWREVPLELDALRRRLQDEAPELLAFAYVPNARAEAAITMQRLLDGAAAYPDVRSLRVALDDMPRVGVDPQDIWDLADETGYEVAIGWGRHDEAGEFEFVLRRKDAAQDMPMFRDPAGVGTPDDHVTHPHHQRRKLDAQLREHLARTLPEYMIPAAFVLVDDIPTNERGKIDREALRARGTGLEGEDGDFQPPSTDTEHTVAALWRDLLGVERVSRTDNFFDLGGHSLLATQLISRVRNNFEIDIPLRALFESPGLAEMCARIDELRGLSQDGQGGDGDGEGDAGAGPEAGSRTEMAIKAAPRPPRLPLSSAQQRLWFLAQLEPDSAAYNVPGAAHLHGLLDVGAMERTLSAIVARHESLRTTFLNVAGQPTQIVHDHVAVSLPIIDLQALPADQRDAEVQRHIDDEIHRLFDLVRGPVIRGSLLRLAEDEHVILLSMHHIVSDGWSMGVLLREVAALYRAEVAGEDAGLAPLEIQYADFALWQRAWLEGAGCVRQIEYWKRQLADLPTIELPADHARADRPAYEGAIRVSEVPLPLTDALNALARDNDATLFMTLLSVFQVLLHRYTGGVDLPVGTPIANRNHREIEPLIGFFVNSLVLRGDLSGDPSFQELVARVRQTTLDAYANQDLPFERLVEVLQPERRFGRNPLFQVMFALQNAPMSELLLPGLTLTPLEIESRATRFDLEFHVWEHRGGLRCIVTYSTGRFQPETIERMLGHFQALMKAVVAAPDRPISTLPMITEGEQATLERWQRGAALGQRGAALGQRGAALAPRAPATLATMFADQAARTPDAVALVCGDQSLRYGELAGRARALGRVLRARGVGPEVRVGVCLARSSALVEALLGVHAAGGAYVPLDPVYPEERLRLMIADSNMALVLTDASTRARFADSGVPVLCLDRDRDQLTAAATAGDESGDALPAHPSNLAYIIYTSGSTGVPKGVAIEHRSAAAMVEWAASVFEPEALAGVLMATSVCFDLSVFELFVPLCRGGTVILAENALALPTLPAAERVTLVNTVPSAMAALLDGGGLPSSVRVVNLAGEPLSTDLVARLYALPQVERVFDLYGPSEDTTYSTFARRAADGPATIGRPVAGTSAYLLDRHLQPVPMGAIGELYLAGDGLARGYLGRAAWTAERFLPDPFSATPGARMYRTGDRARYLDGGDLQFLGRVDHQIKLRGFRIELGEVESAIADHASVRESVVAVRGERLVAYVAPAASAAMDAQRLQDEQVASWKEVFDEQIDLAAAKEPGQDFAGWVSSYTGQPIPDDEMREWADTTAALALGTGPRRVLEIGCGSGAILFRVAPQCERYLATDISTTSLARVRMGLETASLPGVQLIEAEARSLAAVDSGSVDTVLINSVVQYFPDLAYLLEVLAESIRAIGGRGRIILGDVRSLPLLTAFHASVQLARADDTLGLAELRRRTLAAVAGEQELVIDPVLFTELARHWPAIARVRVIPRLERADNELTRFRYSVILDIGGPAASNQGVPAGHDANAGTARRDWQQAGLSSLQDLRAWLEAEQPASVILDRVPMARLAEARALSTLLFGEAGVATAGELKRALAAHARTGVDPAELRALEQLGYALDLCWPAQDPEAGMEVHLTRAQGATAAAQPAPAQDSAAHDHQPAVTPELVARLTALGCTTAPLAQRKSQQVISALRQHLSARLPDYMVPGSFVVLDELPRLPNGKLDRAALPEPELDDSKRRYEPPRTPTQARLAQLWSQVLDVDRVGIFENFFDLGGHSLLGGQILARIREAFGIELPWRVLFDAPVLTDLATRIDAALEQGSAAADEPALVPVPRDKPLALSNAQRRLWFLAELRPAGSFYNLPLAMRIRGPLDHGVMERVLARIVARHETLRTRFVSVDGYPMQVVDAPGDYRLPVVDLAGTPEAEREAALTQVVSADVQQPFDLGTGPLMRAFLVRAAADDHVLVINIHHIVSDGWSTAVLLRELDALYTAFAAGEGDPLPRLAIQYADYAAWDITRFEGAGAQQLGKQLAYWTDKLADLPTLALVTDHTRSSVPSFVGRVGEIDIPAAQRDALQALARGQGTTVFTVLLSSFFVLLHRYSGQTDFAVGTPVANRIRRELEPLIGFFVNNLVLRGDLSGNPSFHTLIGRMHEVVLDAFAHQDVSFETLVDTLKPERDIARNPLFQVLFAFHNTDMAAPDLPGLAIEPFAFDNRTTRFDIEVHLWDGPDGIRGTLSADHELFEHESVARLCRQFQALVADALAAPARPIQRLSLHGQADIRQLVDSMRRGGAQAEDVVRRFEAQAARVPDAVAMIYRDTRVTYDAFNRRANQLARHLRALGLAPDGRVGIGLPRSADLCLAIMAVLKAGGAYVYIDPAYPRERMQDMMAQAGASLLITNQAQGQELDLAARLPGATAIHLDRDQATLARYDDSDLGGPVWPDLLAYVLFTSGSTGRPKGVAMPRRAMTNLIDWQLRSRGPARTMQFASPSFDVSFQEMFSAWCAGQTLVIPDDTTRADFDALAVLIAETGVERAFLPVVAFEQLARVITERGPEPRALREILCAGEQLRITSEVKELFERLDTCILENQYGPTETHIVTFLPLTGAPDTWDTLPAIGTAISNSSMYVLDDDLVPVPAGLPGILYVGGDSVARGYMGRAAETAARFLPDPFAAQPGQRMYCTGDRARLRPDGQIQFLGRNDKQIKLRGFRIEPGEIEVVLTEHAGVRAAAVECRGQGRDARLVAWVAAGPEVRAEDLAAFLKDRLPPYMQPAFIQVMDALPLTQSGKIDRLSLQTPASAPRPEARAARVPASDGEREVARIWSEVLGVSDIGADDSFFEVGGDSLSIMRLRALLEQSFGRSVPLVTLFQHATIAAQASLLGGAQDEDDARAGAQERVDRRQARRRRLRDAKERQ